MKRSYKIKRVFAAAGAISMLAASSSSQGQQVDGVDLGSVKQNKQHCGCIAIDKRVLEFHFELWANEVRGSEIMTSYNKLVRSFCGRLEQLNVGEVPKTLRDAFDEVSSKRKEIDGSTFTADLDLSPATSDVLNLFNTTSKSSQGMFAKQCLDETFKFLVSVSELQPPDSNNIITVDLRNSYGGIILAGCKTFYEAPASGQFQGGAGCKTFYEAPASGQFQGGSGCKTFYESPASGQFQGGSGCKTFYESPASGQIQEGAGCKTFYEKPDSRMYREEPRSKIFYDGPGCKTFYEPSKFEQAELEINLNKMRTSLGIF